MLPSKTNLVIKITNTHTAFTCPKSIRETLEDGANYAQSPTIKSPARCQLRRSGVFTAQPGTYTTLCSSASIANPEHATAGRIFTARTNIVKLSKYSKQ